MDSFDFGGVGGCIIYEKIPLFRACGYWTLKMLYLMSLSHNVTLCFFPPRVRVWEDVDGKWKDSVYHAICFRFIHTAFLLSFTLVLGPRAEILRRKLDGVVQCSMSNATIVYPLPASPLLEESPVSVCSQPGLLERQVASDRACALLLSVADYHFLASSSSSSLLLGSFFTSCRRGGRGPSAVSRRPRGRTLRRSCRRPCGRGALVYVSCEVLQVAMISRL